MMWNIVQNIGRYLPHGDRPGSERDLPGAAFAVTDDQGVALLVVFVAMCLQVRGDLGLQRHHETSIRRAPSRAISSSSERPSTSSCVDSVPTTFNMSAASFPPRAKGRRSIRRENTPPGLRAPRSTTSGHTSRSLQVSRFLDHAFLSKCCLTRLRRT
jgi:hypothetical protein